MRLTLQIALSLFPFFAFSQIAGDYRTSNSGSWTDPGNWQRHNGTTWIDAVASPTNSDNVITILGGHSISIPAAASVTADQIVLQGNLTVLSTATLTVANGAGDDLAISGATSTLNVSGTLHIQNLATINNPFSAANVAIVSGASYYHNYTTSFGNLPTATWHPQSTLYLTAFDNNGLIAANATWNQSFGNIVYNSSAQSAVVNFAANINDINGNFSVLSTGSSALQIGTSETYTLTIGESNTAVGGDLTISGTSRVFLSTSGSVTADIYGNFNFTSSILAGSYLTQTGASTMNVYGDFTMNATTSGRFRLASVGTTGNGTLNLYNDFSLITGRIDENGSNPTQGNIRFLKTGTQNYVNTGTIAGYINYYIAASSTVEAGTSPFSGSVPSAFVLDGTVAVGSTEPLGAIYSGNNLGNIRVASSSRTYNEGATIIYRGASELYLGAGHPTASGITTIIDNPSGVRLATNITTNGTLRLESGTLYLNDFRLTIGGTLESAGGNFGGSELSSLYVQGTGDGAIGSLPFLAAANVVDVLQLNRTGNNVSAEIPNSLTIVSKLNLLRGTLVNSGTVVMGDSAFITRYETGALTGNSPVSSAVPYNVTYRSFTPTGGPYAAITSGAELPSSTTDLGSLTISLQEEDDALQLSSNVYINNNFTLTKGTVTTGAFDITMRGINWVDNSGTFIGGTGAVVFDADSTRVGGGRPQFQNVSLTTGSKVEFSKNVTISGDVAFHAEGEFDMFANTITLAGADAQNLSFGGSTVSNLTIAKSGGADVVLSSQMLLTGILQFSSPSSSVNLDSNGNLRLVSTSDSGGAGTTATVYRLLNNNSISGQVETERFIAVEGNYYRFISSPVANATVSQLKDDILVQGNFTDPHPTQNICDVQAKSTTTTLFWYNEALAGGINNGYTGYPAAGQSSTTTPLVVGRGYAAFIRQCNQPNLIDLAGTLNQGVINLPVSYTSSDPAADGWNLVGNPYASTIDWDVAGWTKTRISAAISVTDNGSGMTRVYEANVTNTLPNGYLASGQAFWVRATAANPVLTVRESTKVLTVAEYYRERPAYLPSLEIALSDGKYIDQAYIKIQSDALTTVDDFDAPKIFNPNFSLSTISTDNVPMAINALSALSCDGAGLSVRTDGLKPGTYSLSLDSRGFFEDYQFVLIDNFEKTRTIIKDKTIQFTVTDVKASSAIDRFKIEVETSAPSEISLTSTSNACNEDAQVIITKSEKNMLYEVYSSSGARLTTGVIGSGEDLVVQIPLDSIQQGANKLYVTGSRSCVSTRSPEFTVNKFSDIGVELVQKFDCSIGGTVIHATSPQRATFVWYETMDGRKPFSDGEKLELQAGSVGQQYFVEAIDNETGCRSARTAVTVEHIDQEPLVITLEGNMLRSNYADGNQWFFNGTLIPEATSADLNALEPGLYEVFNVSTCSGKGSFMVSENDLPGITVHPNPTTDYATIHGLGDDVQQVELGSAMGQTLAVYYRKGQKFDGKISLNSVPDGLYLLIVTKADKKYSYRIVKRAK
jgi:hypothetical protein